MKILFDTNIYVSEALVGGLAQRIINAAILARWRIYADDYLLDETQRVLSDKLELGARYGLMVRQRIARRVEHVDPVPSRHTVPSDPKDSPILKAAVSAGVDYLVTDDRHLLSMQPYEGIRIVSMRNFAQILREQGLLTEP
jgi:uncharacterized protein